MDDVNYDNDCICYEGADDEDDDINDNALAYWVSDDINDNALAYRVS